MECLELATETLFTEPAMNKYLVLYHLTCSSYFFLSVLEKIQTKVFLLKQNKKIHSLITNLTTTGAKNQSFSLWK